ncbi:hypothetical protein GVO57_09030 [Sphingomonas changnyeongensis]|uniref:Uncharacterized protein n=1 Tax=Sphingomonas changnyeongensis TaxID=2698679 RepID=A0A7Z2NXA4_9SPHN|nr:hypothetical protein [Sphingomonas changnyeongensis]QHL90934.1 hypothetical protein GVO57_09030 [Sphingomonas changnyeongensis]
MMDPIVYLEMGLMGLAGTGIVTMAALAGWRGWLDLKRLELQDRRQIDPQPAPSAASRIELADLKERIRKLEAIAAGVDL